MIVTIIYCSLTDNTIKTAEFIANNIPDVEKVNKVDFTMYLKLGLNPGQISMIEEADILCVASLAWCFTCPPWFTEAVRSLDSSIMQKPFYVVAGHGGGPGRQTKHLFNLMSRHGNTKCIGVFEIKGPSGYIPLNKKLSDYSRQIFNFPEEKCREFVEEMMERLHNEDYSVPRMRPFYAPLTLFKAPFFQRTAVGPININVDECISCGKCARLCVSGAIKMIKNEERGIKLPVYDRDLCVGCTRCLNVCPKDIIHGKHTDRVRWDFSNKDNHIVDPSNEETAYYE
ncbi:hypothetical protein PCE1_001791 [Barthelona sp. PCE]